MSPETPHALPLQPVREEVADPDHACRVALGRAEIIDLNVADSRLDITLVVPRYMGFDGEHYRFLSVHQVMTRYWADAPPFV